MTDGIPDYGKIAAKWASQYADQPDGATLASGAKRRASEYETEAEELGTEANFIEHLDFQGARAAKPERLMVTTELEIQPRPQKLSSKTGLSASPYKSGRELKPIFGAASVSLKGAAAIARRPA